MNICSKTDEVLKLYQHDPEAAIFTLMLANTFRGFYLREIARIQEYGGQIELLYLDHYEQGEVSHASTR